MDDRAISRFCRQDPARSGQGYGQPSPGASDATKSAVTESLDDIGLRLGSDKSSASLDYLTHRQRMLDPLRDKPITLVEFCQNSDVSLRVWRSFFPRARIVGIFGDERFRSFASDGIEIEVGSQSDPVFLRRLADTMHPHVVIDDGSHFWCEQLFCLEILFPVMPPDGLYFVEALHTSFGEDMEAAYGLNSATATFDMLTLLAKAVAACSAIKERPNLSLCVELASEVAFSARTAMVRRKAWPVRVACVVPAASAAAETRCLDNGGSYLRGPATIVNAHDWLRRDWQRQRDAGDVVPPDAQVHLIPGAVVHGRGIVETSSGQIVRESLLNSEHARDIGPMSRLGPDERLYFTRRTVLERRFTRADNCVLLKQTWDDNYGHWLIESLPRVALVEQVMPLAECHFVVGSASPAVNAVYRESLNALGIRDEQIVPTSDYSFAAELLIYPAPLTVQPWVKAPCTVRTAERVGRAIVGGTANGPSVLYVSRNRMSTRRLRNENDILDMLCGLGAVVVHPETMSFAEQIRAFSSASLVIGSLGGALSNIAFSPRGVRLLALTTELMQDDFFWDLLAHKDGVYASLHGTATDPGLGMQSDFTVDLNSFGDLIDRLQAY